jgi:hypothetical protein
MNQVIAFEKPPFFIDLVIHHPIISACLTSPYYFAILAFTLCALTYFLIRFRANKPKARAFAICGALTLILLTVGGIASPHIRRARTPTSSTIIAGMVDSKAITGVGPFKKYYFVVNVNGEKFGVRTTKEIFELPQYKPYATLDYSLYTYVFGDQITVYRFVAPDLKLKPERGNLQ